MTFFRTNADGTCTEDDRWNTLYPDAAWDIGVHEGPILLDQSEYDPADTAFWLNDRTNMSVNIQIRSGETRVFGGYVPRGDAGSTAGLFYGTNFFIDGSEANPGNGTARISVYSETNGNPPGGDKLPFSVDASGNTMGWPIAGTAGSGTLVYQDDAKGIRITLTDYAVYQPTAANLDMGIRQNAGGDPMYISIQDGILDMCFEFTLKAERMPRAYFTATPDSGTEPLTVAFDATGSLSPNGAITKYEWDFGDGSSATGVTTSHDYTTAGHFTATLTITDALGLTAAASQPIDVAFRSEDCSNGIDDDGDQLADCADSDCASAANCQGKQFHRGDANGDRQINITDGIYVLNYLFLGGPTPGCLEAANPNDDPSINITDGIYILNYLFLGGPGPAAPGPVESPCGIDPAGSPTDLGCESYNC
jgi:PKD repeat protein